MTLKSHHFLLELMPRDNNFYIYIYFFFQHIYLPGDEVDFFSLKYTTLRLCLQLGTTIELIFSIGYPDKINSIALGITIHFLAQGDNCVRLGILTL